MVWVFWKMRLSVLTHTITVLLHEVKGWASTAGYELVCLSRALGGHNHTLILCCALSALQPLPLFLWIAALCTRSGPFFSYFSFFLFYSPSGYEISLIVFSSLTNHVSQKTVLITTDFQIFCLFHIAFSPISFTPSFPNQDFSYLKRCLL